MVIGDQHRPLLARHDVHAGDQLAGRVQALFGVRAAEGERSRIRRVGQEIMHRRVAGRRPGDPPGSVLPAGQQQPVLAQRQQHLAGRAEFIEPPVDGGDRLGHRLVRRDDHPVVPVVVQADRQALFQLAAGGLVPQALGQPGPDQVQLSLAEGALEAQDEAVVIGGGVVDAVGVGDQRAGQRAQVQQLVPVGVRPGQPGDLQREDDPGLAEPDIGDQLGEPGAARRARAGPAQVLVDHHHLVRGPAQPRRALPQVVLPGQALGMDPDLQQRGLADIYVRIARPV